MKLILTRGFFAAVLLLGMAVSMSSCYKVKDSVAKVTVLDANGNPVANAEVVLRPEASDPLETRTFKWTDVTATTDAAGVATFNFNEDFEAGMAGLLVLTIDVPPYTSVGIIKVEEQVTNEKTVELP